MRMRSPEALAGKALPEPTSSVVMFQRQAKQKDTEGILELEMNAARGKAAEIVVLSCVI